MNREGQSGNAADTSVAGTSNSQTCEKYIPSEIKQYTPEIINVSYTWRVHNLSDSLRLRQSLEPLKSPVFFTDVNGNKSKWFLKFYLDGNVEGRDYWSGYRDDNWSTWRDHGPNHRLSSGRGFRDDDYSWNWSTEDVVPRGKSRELRDRCIRRLANSEYLSLYLFLESSDEKTVFAKFTLYVLSADLKEITSMSRHQQFQKNSPMNHGGFQNFLSKDTLFSKKHDLWKSDSLTIKCEIAICSEEAFNISRQLEEVRSVEAFKLTTQLKSLLDRGEMSDITLEVGRQKFPAHKAILAARSPVFAAMFQHEMKEQKENKVIITDIDPIVLKEALVFIYTDESPNLETMAADLLPVAEKYDIGQGSLKRMCEEIMCLKINVHNAAEFLSIADLHGADKLKIKTINFITNRTSVLMNTQAWRDLLSKNTTSLSKAFEQASK